MIARRPAFAAAALLLSGIVLAFALPTQPWILLLLAALAAIAALSVAQRPGLASALLAIAIISVGVVSAELAYFRFASDDIGAFTSSVPRWAQLELVLDEPPTIAATAGLRSLPPHQKFIATVRAVLTRSGWIPARGRIAVEALEPGGMLADGQIIRALGSLSRPSPATDPGALDWSRIERSRRILATFRIAHADNIEIVADPGAGLLGWERAWARRLLARGFDDTDADDFELLETLTLGDAEVHSQATQQAFRELGAAYLFSISGMHFAIIAAGVYGICRLLMISPRKACAACLATVFLYSISVTPGVSALRAAVAMIVILGGVLLGRGTDRLQILGAAVIIVLLLNPMDAFNAGFVLALFCILGILMIAPPLVHWLNAWIEEPLSSGAPLPWPKRIMKALLGWLAISLAAWVIGMPIVARNFEQLSFASVPAGLLLLPLVALTLWGGCGKIILTLLWPSTARVWAFLADQPIALLKTVVAMIGRLPATSLPVAKPPLFAIAAYYLLILLPLLPWPRRWLKHVAALVAVLAVCSFALGLTCGFPMMGERRPGTLTITVLDVGEGRCVVVQPAEGPPFLIDAGSSSIGELTQSVLGPFLAERQQRAVGSVFLTNTDYPHFSALPLMLPRYNPSGIFTSASFSDEINANPPAQMLLDQLALAGKSPRVLHQGDTLRMASSLTLDVLWPPDRSKLTANNSSLVLRLNFGNQRVLFCGDIQTPAIASLLRSTPSLAADVLIAPHDGIAEPASARLLAAVNPRIIISSDRAPLTEKQVEFDRLAQGRLMYRTSRCGAIDLRLSTGGPIQVQTFLGGN
jgi:competence protein ComEC